MVRMQHTATATKHTHMIAFDAFPNTRASVRAEHRAKQSGWLCNNCDKTHTHATVQQHRHSRVCECVCLCAFDRISTGNTTQKCAPCIWKKIHRITCLRLFLECSDESAPSLAFVVDAVELTRHSGGPMADDCRAIVRRLHRAEGGCWGARKSLMCVRAVKIATFMRAPDAMHQPMAACWRHRN